MNPVLKTIFGSIARHWFGVFLGVVAGRGILDHETVQRATSLLSDDMVSNLAVSLVFAVPPATISIGRSLRLRLRERLALRMAHGSTEHQLNQVIAEAPASARLAATLTTDPLKL